MARARELYSRNEQKPDARLQPCPLHRLTEPRNPFGRLTRFSPLALNSWQPSNWGTHEQPEELRRFHTPRHLATGPLFRQSIATRPFPVSHSFHRVDTHSLWPCSFGFREHCSQSITSNSLLTLRPLPPPFLLPTSTPSLAKPLSPYTTESLLPLLRHSLILP